MSRYVAIAIAVLALLLPGHARADLNVSFATDGNGSIVGDAEQTVAAGGATTPVTAVPAEAFHFYRWSGDNGFSSYENPLTLSTVTSSMRITASFAPNRYEVIAHGYADIADFKTGSYHTVVLRNDGMVVAWGGTDGQSAVNGMTDVSSIGVGPYHSLLVKKDGSLVARGVWIDHADETKTTPVTLPPELLSAAASRGGVRCLTGGYSHSVALFNDGTVLAWGDNTYQQLDLPDFGGRKVVTVAAGHFHTVAIMDDSSIVAWGRNSESELAPSADDLARANAAGVSVTRIAPNAYQTAGLHFVAADASAYHTVALADGKVICWGDNEKGQSLVPSGAGSGIIAVAAGGHHTLALRSDGTLLAWGDNTFGQSTIPSGLNGISAISAGAYFNLVKRKELVVAGWGNNVANQCNVPSWTYKPIPNGTVTCTPTLVAKESNFTSVCTVTPAAGASLATFEVNGINRSAEVANGSITFTNISEFLSITALFATGSDSSSLATRPHAPNLVTAHAVNGQALVAFAPPVYDGSVPITGYTATSSPDGITATGSGSPITVPGLAYGTVYTFTVTASNQAGTSPASWPSNRLGIASVVLGGLSATYDGSAKAAAVTTIPSGVPVAVTYDDAAAVPVNAGSYSVVATVGGSVYQGSSSGTLTIAKAEQSIAVTKPAPTIAALGASFVIAASAPGGAVLFGSQGGCSNVGATFTMTSSTEPCVVLYDQLGSGNYNPAPQVKSVTAAVAAMPPGAPGIATITAVNGEAGIAVTPPASDGGSPITGYTVSATPGDIRATGTASPIVVTGLRNGTAYTFAVSAINVAGTGPSATSGTVTPYPNGDLNGDGVVDLSDALLALRLSVGLESANAAYLTRGDVAPMVSNKPQPDGKVDVGDVLVILRKALGTVSW